MIDSLAFGRGGGGAKAAPKAAGKGKADGPDAAKAAGKSGPGGGGDCGTGTVSGKRGFQPGNKCGGQGNRNQHVAGLRKAHTAKAAVARSHVRKGAALSPEGRASIKAAAAAHRELQAARAEHKVAQRESRNAGRRAGPKEAASPAPAKAPIERRVEASHREASLHLAEGASRKLSDLKAGAGAGTHDGEAILAHVDRIARGATKDQLFAAARAAGIDHGGATTKKALVDHLKNHVYDHGRAEAARRAASTPATEAPSTPSAPRLAVGKGGEADHAAAARKIDRLIGAKGAHENIPAIVGATPGAKVSIFPAESGKGASAYIEHPDYDALRTVYRDGSGRKVISNDQFYVARDKQGRGIGSEVFSNQVREARAAGFDLIKTNAFGSAQDTAHNGYYTWARMGYDAKLHDTDRRLLPGSLAGATRVSDLMKSPEGRDHWKQHGRTIEMTFDLRPDSVSSRVHAAYLAEREARNAAFADPAPAEGAPAPRGDVPDFTDDELAAADRAWDKVATEEAGP